MASQRRAGGFVVMAICRVAAEIASGPPLHDMHGRARPPPLMSRPKTASAREEVGGQPALAVIELLRSSREAR
eukprot:15450811-Alexandrium_andersonii.AAC.1